MWERIAALAGTSSVGKLTDYKIRNAKAGIHGDGAGLHLRVKPSGAKSWVLRVQHMGKREDIGLGGWPVVTLAKAREKALELRRVVKEGGSARAERDQKRVVIPTFQEAMLKAHTELSKGWSVRNAASFKSSLEQHIAPKIGSKRVDHVTTTDVIACLSPTWTTKPALSQKLRVRLLQVLAFAKANGWRKEALPDARELRDGLARAPKGGNYAAVPYREAPAVVADQLGKGDTSGRLALLFTITTAARSGEVRSARWEHIDIENRTWTRPAELMKGRVKHVVTLNDAALSILDRARMLSDGKGLVFPGSRAGSQLSDMTISKALRTAGRKETVHGFRSTFRDWAAEQMPTVPSMVAEMALAHSVGTKTEQAYLRSDLRDLRRALMDAWGRFVAPALVSSSNVIEMIRTSK
jgi:integrase